MSSVLATPGSVDTTDVQQLIANEVAAQLSQLPPAFKVLSSDPTGAPFPRGEVAMWSGDAWVGVPSTFFTLSAAGTAWIAGGGGDSPISVQSTTVPVGTNGTPGYVATAVLAGGSVDSTGKYKTVAVQAGALPGWGTLNKVVGGFTVTGNPNAVAATAVTVRVTDMQDFFIDVAITIPVVAAGQALAIDLPATINLQVGVNVDIDVVALYVTGGSGTISAAVSELPPLPNPSSATLPNKKVRIDLDGSVTTKVGKLYSRTVAWGGVLDPPNAVASFPIHVTVTDSLGAVASDSCTVNINPPATPSVDVASWVSTDYNLATGVGHYQGTVIPVVPSGVAAALNNVAAGTRIFTSVAGGAGGLAVGCAAGASSWTGGILTTLADFDLLGTTPGTQKATIILAPNQPVNAPGVTGQIMAHANAVNQVLNAEINGNRANQTVGVNTDPNPAGCYYTGVRRASCGIGGGAATGHLILRNIRGVVGSKNTNYNGTGKLATETFCFQDITGAGADQLTIELINDDGGTKNNTSSGAVFQYRQLGAPAWVVTLLGCHNQRHGIGCYCGGSGFVLIDATGTYTGNGHLFNFEAGDTAGNASRAPTGDIVVAVINGTTVNTSGNDMICSCNSNNASGSTSQQINSLTIASASTGFVSTGDGEFIDLSGSSGHPGTVTVNNVDSVSPTTCANNFGSPANAAADALALFLVGCRVHLTVGGSVASKGGALHAGNGIWTPF